MEKWIFVTAMSMASSLCQAAQLHLHCETLPDTGKLFTFQIEIDQVQKMVFVDGQYTTHVFISEYLTSFVLADENDGYAFDIYPSGRLLATRQRDKSTLLMQCT